MEFNKSYRFSASLFLNMKNKWCGFSKNVSSKRGRVDKTMLACAEKDS